MTMGLSHYQTDSDNCSVTSKMVVSLEKPGALSTSLRFPDCQRFETALRSFHLEEKGDAVDQARHGSGSDTPILQGALVPLLPSARGRVQRELFLCELPSPSEQAFMSDRIPDRNTSQCSASLNTYMLTERKRRVFAYLAMVLKTVWNQTKPKTYAVLTVEERSDEGDQVYSYSTTEGKESLCKSDQNYMNQNFHIHR